jgi:hypothetical protein
VHVGGLSLSTAADGGDSLDIALRKIHTLRSSFTGLQSTLLAFSRTAAAFSQASGGVATEWEGLYAGSPARANSLQSFLTNQRRISSCGDRVYKDVFGWDVLKTFDDWDGEAARMAAELEKFSQAKKNRMKRSEPLTAKEEANMETARMQLETQTNAFLEKRYAALDRAFVRFMELQLEFFREGASASEKYQPIVENYRKRFPRQTGGADTGEVLGLPPRQEPVRSNSTPPHQEDERPNGVQQQRRPTQTQAPAAQQQRPPQQQQQQQKPQQGQQNGDDTSDSESESGSETDSSADDTDVETPHPPVKKTSNAGAGNSGAGVIDLFDFPSTAAPAKPAASKPAKASPSSSSSNEVNLDFFGAPTNAPATSSSSSSSSSGKHPKSSPKHDDEFDFTGGGGLKVPKPLSVSSSSPELKKDRGVQSFDPFGMSSPTVNKPAPAERRPTRSASPPANAPGTSTSGMVNAYIPPTAQLQEHIEEQQAAKVAQLREAEAQQENALEARRDAESSVEAKLTAWETNKDGAKKNIRNLLSTVHTVLWPNSGWKPIGIADLIDFAGIKKAHMKVIRVVRESDSIVLQCAGNTRLVAHIRCSPSRSGSPGPAD